MGNEEQVNQIMKLYEQLSERGKRKFEYFVKYYHYFKGLEPEEIDRLIEEELYREAKKLEKNGGAENDHIPIGV